MTDQKNITKIISANAENAEKMALNIFFKDFILATVLKGLKILKVLRAVKPPLG